MTAMCRQGGSRATVRAAVLRQGVAWDTCSPCSPQKGVEEDAPNPATASLMRTGLRSGSTGPERQGRVNGRNYERLGTGWDRGCSVFGLRDRVSRAWSGNVLKAWAVATKKEGTSNER